jgi:hypothetical protein
VSGVPLDKAEVTKLLRKVIVSESDNLEGSDRILGRYLSGVIELDDDFQVISPDHKKSLEHLDSKVRIIEKFDKEALDLIKSELDL